MCGIIGIASTKLNKEGVSVFEDLLIVSNVRGRWGAGVAIAAGDKLRTVKNLYSGCDVLDMKAYRDLAEQPNVHTMLGHTRWPTKGEQEMENVHPHITKNITGVHNGTLDKVDGVHVPFKENDSKLFYNHASEVGFLHAHSRMQGAFCFVFFDHTAKTLNFIRNTQRPLWFAKVAWGTNGQCLLWASEKGMLEFALGRKAIRQTVEYVELPINELWSIPAGFKLGQDFEVTTGLYAGRDLWKSHVHRPNSSSVEDAPWGRGFRGSGVDRTISRTAANAANVGKTTYIFKDGEFIEKTSILNPPAKQVTLPRTEGSNELQGKEEVRPSDEEGVQRGVLHEQRPAVVNKVSLGNSGGAFLKNLDKLVQKHLSKDEQTFYDDDLSEIYPGIGGSVELDELDGPNYAAANDDEEAERVFNEQVDRAFQDLLAVKNSDLYIEPDEEPEELVETLKGCWVTRKDYLQILSDGCLWTGDPAVEDDPVYWITKREFISQIAVDSYECMLDLMQIYPSCQIVQDWLAGKFQRSIPPENLKNKIDFVGHNFIGVSIH